VENFVLRNILSGSEKDSSKGIYIILFNANSIPPHLLLSIAGEIYSITDSGRQIGSPLEKLVAFIKRKNVPALFVEVKKPEDWDIEKLKSAAREHFLKYDKVVEGKVSCLFPVRDIIAAVFGNEMLNANFIFELLPLMEKINALGQTFALNMESIIVNGNFELLTYTNEQIKEALQSATLTGNSL
jgi:hypothetical protein